MGQKINSISELGFDLGFSETDVEEINEDIKGAALPRLLTTLRAQSGLTQSELAEKLGVTQSYVSKLEHSKSDKLCIADVHNYVGALGYETSLNIFKPKNLTQEVISTYEHLVKLFEKFQESTRSDVDILLNMAEFESLAARNIIKLASTLVNSSREKIEKVEKLPDTKILIEDEPFEEVTLQETFKKTEKHYNC